MPEKERALPPEAAGSLNATEVPTSLPKGPIDGTASSGGGGAVAVYGARQAGGQGGGDVCVV